MKRPIHTSTSVALAVLSLLLGACSAFEKAARDLASGAMDGVKEQLADPETKEVLKGVTESLAEGVDEQIPELASSIREEVRPLVAELRDEALGESTREKAKLLKDDLLGEETRRQLAGLRSELLGEATRNELSALRDELLGEAMRQQLETLRDELIGEATSDSIQVLIEAAVSTAAASYRTQVRPALWEDIEKIRQDLEKSTGVVTGGARNVIWTLVAGIAGLGVLGFLLAVRYLRHRRMLEMITVQIEKMPDPAAKKELKNRIQKKAQETKLEPQLQRVLEGQGL